MANLIIKPTSGGSLILQDEGGTAAHTIDASGNTTLAGTTNNLGTVTAATINGGSIGDAVTGNGLAFKKIGAGTFSTSSAVDLGQDLGTYRVHKLFFTAHSSTTGGSGNMYMRFKQGGSWITATDYAYSVHLNRSNSGSASTYYDEAASYIKVTADSSRADRKTAWEITIHNAVEAERTLTIICGTGPNHDGARRLGTLYGGGIYDNTAVIQDIRIYPQSYTITGSWELYGIV